MLVNDPFDSVGQNDIELFNEMTIYMNLILQISYCPNDHSGDPLKD